MPTYRAMPASKVLGLPLVSSALVSVVGWWSCSSTAAGRRGAAPYRGRLTGRVILHCKPRKGKACGYFFL